MAWDALDKPQFVQLLREFAHAADNEGSAADQQRNAIREYIRGTLIPRYDPLAPRGFDALDGDDFSELLETYAIDVGNDWSLDVYEAAKAIKQFAREKLGRG